MIKVQDLSKIFRTEEVETIALDKVSFEVKDGEFVAIMGPSGCGKSTVLNILGLLDNPTSGQYWLGDKEVSGLHENERTAIRKGQIGFVFQSFNLIDELNVEENIELPLTYLGISKAERKQKVQEVMKRMNISHRAKHFPHQLSGGQQQRGLRPQAHPCRRAYRQPRLKEWCRGDAAAHRTQPGRCHYRHGHPQCPRCGNRPSHHSLI